METYTGKIQFYNQDQSFGFIETGEGYNNVFMHRGSIANPASICDLIAGVEVTYKLVEGRDGKTISANVRILNNNYNSDLLDRYR